LAQDAVQEAFLAIWRSADRFLAERAKASTWILTLVHRRSVDLVRREDRRRGEPLESAGEPAAPETVEDEATLGFERRVVQQAALTAAAGAARGARARLLRRVSARASWPNGSACR
jgi:DNA-directed RNA polymerase specialized sigma24 family protein